MKFSPVSRSASVLGLAWNDGQLHLANLSRAKGGLSAGPVAQLPWIESDLAPAEPATAATALRRGLAAAGIRTRACVAALPPEWIMSVSVPLPDLPAEDVEAFLQLAAERSFPCPPEELQIARSSVRLDGQTLVTLLAVRQQPLDRLAALLHGAGLKPLGLTFALPLLPDIVPADGSGALTLILDQAHTLLLGTAGGGIALLRSLDPATDGAEALVRELRVSWEQLSVPLRTSTRRLRVLGGEAALAAVQPALARWAGATSLAVETVPAVDLGARRADAVARQWLEGNSHLLQFLPPQPSRWQRLLARYPARRLGAVGLTVAALLVAAAGALLWQEFTLWRLHDRWAAMRPAVETTEKLQASVRQFRSWTDATPQNLAILRLVSEAFPRTGSVTAKTFEIRGGSAVTIAGTTTDSNALLQTLDKLRQTPAVSDLKLDQIRGRSPAQFTFKFTWKAAAGS